MNIINEFFVSFILIKLYFKFKVCRKIKFPLLWKFYFSKWKFYFSADKMPKTVFKYLWDYMKEGKEIFAYVKNKTKDNNYYWVFANVTPSIDVNNNIIGYYSVRRMPNKSAISTIESLYSDLLRAEQQQGLNKGVEMLKNFCKDADKTYNELIFSLQEAK